MGDSNDEVYIRGHTQDCFAFKNTQLMQSTMPSQIDTKKEDNLSIVFFGAVRRGLEPLTPCVTGTYSNQLN